MSNDTNSNLAVVESPVANLVEASANIESINKSLAALKTAKVGINLSPEYFEFESKGEKARGIFLGFGSFDKADEDGEVVKTLSTVVWIDGDKNMWSNAGTALVGAMNGVKKGTAVEIEYLGTKKVKSGNMKRYAVRPLITE